MAHKDGDFLLLYFLLDDGNLDDDTNFNVEVDAAVSEVAAGQGHSTCKCDRCDKICKSKRGLTRHTEMMHTVELDARERCFIVEEVTCVKLIFILKNCVGIITADMCLPEAKQKAFEHFIISLREANILWEKLRPIDLFGN